MLSLNRDEMTDHEVTVQLELPVKSVVRTNKSSVWESGVVIHSMMPL